MRKTLLIATLIFISGILYSQTVFNRIIADTVGHITSSVLASDTGYTLLTGTNNEYGVRSFAITSLDINGNRNWKKIVGDNNIEYWEGYSNSLKNDGEFFQSSGSIKDLSVNEFAIFIIKYDNIFNIVDSAILVKDSIYKSCFNQVRASDGCYYLSGAIVYPENETVYLLLLKINSDLEFIWGKNYTLANISEAGDQIIETKDHDILIGGLTFTNYTNEDWYLLKTDTSGAIIWEKNYGHSTRRDGIIKGLIETSDSCYLACGGYPAAKYGGSASGTILWDGCLRKINGDGDLIWTKNYRTYSKITNTQLIRFDNTIYSIINKNGDLYILGGEKSYVGTYRAYLQKISKNGDICWKRDYYAIEPGSTYQWLVSFQNTNDNGFILAGYGNQYGSYGYNPPQQSWLVKTDSLGLDGLSNTELPELNIDLELPDTLCMDDTLGVYAYISGKSAPYTIEFSTGQVIDSIYYPPTFVPVEIGLTYINLTWGGSTFFEETITEATLTNHEWGQCIAKPVEFYTPHTPGLQQITITVTDAYGESKTISKSIVVNDCGVGMENFDNEAIKIYPNPANKSLTICLPGNTNQATAVITDVLGRVYGRYDLQGKESEIDISHLQAGPYFLQITFNGKTENMGFVKE